MASEDEWRPWLAVAAAFFTQFIVCGITYSLGVFHVIFKDIFFESHFNTSWIGSILLYVVALSSVMLRFITRFWGPRVSIILGGLLASAGLALCMLAQRLFHLYLSFGLLTGIGFGLATWPSFVAVERCFIHRRFQALSIVVSGIGAGIITFPVLILQLLVHFAWRGTMLLLAGAALNLCVCGMVMRPADHDKELRLRPMLSCSPLRIPIFYGMCLANLFWSFGSTVIYMYLPSYAMAKGTSFETCLLLVSYIGISSFGSRAIFAFMGPRSTLDIVTSGLCSILLGVVVTAVTPLLFNDICGQIAYTIIFGFYSGFWTTFLSQVSREILGPEYVAVGNGYLSIMIAIGSLTGGPFAGLLLDRDSDFKNAFFLAGACLLTSSIMMVLFKVKTCRAGFKVTSYIDNSTAFLGGLKVREQHVPLILDNMTCSHRKSSTTGNDLVLC